MLSDLFQVCQWIFLSLYDACHASQSRALKLFASVKRVAVFHETEVVTRDIFDEMFSCGKLSQSDFVMFLIIQNVEL